MKMLKTMRLILVLGTIVSFISARKTEPTDKKSRLKYTIVSEDTTTKYIFNERGDISEVESWFDYQKFYYDGKGRLTSEERADDPTALLASRDPKQKRYIMTAKNPKITGYTLFEYDAKGRLVLSKHYFNFLNYPGHDSSKDHKFQITSITTFIYDQHSKISRSNLCDTNSVVNQFHTYEYDQRGNMIKEEYYSCLEKDSLPKRISTTSYKFDHKNNPNTVYKDLGTPGYATNPNNVVETKFVDWENKVTINKSSFIYSANGFPLEENNGRTKFKFIRE